MPLAKKEDFIELDASKMRKQASIIDKFPIADSVNGLIFMLHSYYTQYYIIRVLHCKYFRSIYLFQSYARIVFK